MSRKTLVPCCATIPCVCGQAFTHTDCTDFLWTAGLSHLSGSEIDCFFAVLARKVWKGHTKQVVGLLENAFDHNPGNFPHTQMTLSYQ
jgi:hypothetical protein